MKEVLGFFGEYRFLSNFWPAKVMLDGVEYPSTECAYQAAKTLDPEMREKIRLGTPAQAKRIGKKIQLRDNWLNLKLQIMEDLVRQKFTNHQDLKEKLLATGDGYLEETNHWHDVFFGVCNGVGENHLGKILMNVRSDLQSENSLS